MFRRTSTAVLPILAAACAGHHASTLRPVPSADEMRVAFACVVDAVASAGYPMSTNPKRFAVWGQIRENVGTEDPRVQGDNVGGIGSKRRAGEAGTPYTVDGVTAHVVVDDRTGRIKVDAEAYTGAGLTARSGYVQRPASSRGIAAVTHARACVAPAQAAELSGS